jgi:hypothetical protein
VERLNKVVHVTVSLEVPGEADDVADAIGQIVARALAVDPWTAWKVRKVHG